MKWLHTTNGGWINLDHVRTITTSPDGRTWRLFAADGEHLGTTSTYPDATFDALIPATAGQEAIVFAWWGDNAGDPVPYSTADRRAVVAWQLTSVGTIPILAGDPCDSPNEVVLVLHPGGQVESVGDCTWDNLERAVEDLCNRYRDRANARAEIPA